jgi:cyclase
MSFEPVTPNVFTDVTIRGCNPSYVVTSDGTVVVDTPQMPSKAVAMRAEAESHGPIQFVINTEHHVDHIFGNYFFKGAGKVIHHQGLADNFMISTPLLDPFDYAAEGTKMSDPDGAALMPTREVYFQDPNRAKITFTGDVVLHVGDHTFNLIWTPGHTPGQIAVHVPEERVVFTGDTVFNDVQTWVMASDVDQWVAALNTISRLDVDKVVPGHGAVTDLAYLQTQKAVLLDW